MRPDHHVVLRSWLEKNAKGVNFVGSSVQRRGSSIVDGTNSDGQVGSTKGWTAANISFSLGGPMLSPSVDYFSDQYQMNGLFALMRSSMRAAVSWVVDGTNSDGQRRSTNGWTAAKLYPIMDNHLNELFIWFKVRWSVIGGDVILGMDAAKSDAGGIMVLRSGNLMFLSQKSDLRGNQHTCGMLRASSTRLVWVGLLVPL